MTELDEKKKARFDAAKDLLLLEAGAAVIDNWLLELCAIYGYTEIAEMLMYIGDKVFSGKDYELTKNSALSLAIEYGHVEIATLLLSNGATLADPYDWRPLWKAIDDDNVPMVNLLKTTMVKSVFHKQIEKIKELEEKQND